MRIIIDTEAHETSPVVSSTLGATATSTSSEGGSAPAEMQGAADTLSPVNGADPISAGAPSAELVAAILAASPATSATQAMDGGGAPM